MRPRKGRVYCGPWTADWEYGQLIAGYWVMSFAATCHNKGTIMLLTENTQRLLRIEAKLDAIIEHLKLDFNPDEAIQKLAKEGDKIGAIRLHRSFHGIGLVEAKKRVETMG